MRAFLSKRAARAAERIDARWRERANDPGVFARDFLEAIELLEAGRGPGSPYPTAKHPSLKRLLLRRSHGHLYFEIDEANQTIQILHVWDGRRARPPKL